MRIRTVPMGYRYGRLGFWDKLLQYTNIAKGTNHDYYHGFYQQPKPSHRLPADLRLPDNIKRVDVRARGCERIISPAGQSWDSFFLDEECVAEDFLQQRASQTQPEREAL